MERSPVPLALLHHPLVVTLTYFNAGETVLIDADLREQQCCEGEVVVGANPQGEVVLISKMGGGEVEAVELLQGIEFAMGKVKELGKRVETALEGDRRERDKAGAGVELSAENER